MLGVMSVKIKDKIARRSNKHQRTFNKYNEMRASNIWRNATTGQTRLDSLTDRQPQIASCKKQHRRNENYQQDATDHQMYDPCWWVSD